MFLDLIVDPNWYTTVPTETTAVPAPGESSAALYGCIAIVLAVTIVMMLVRHGNKKRIKA